MKILCPNCKKVLYTNPFGRNKYLKCPYCEKEFVLSTRTEQLLKIMLVIDLIEYAVLGSVLSVFFPNKNIYIVMMVCFLVEYMFEFPQKSLYAIGKLEYIEKKDEEF